jgi:hypothetical protein
MTKTSLEPTFLLIGNDRLSMHEDMVMQLMDYGHLPRLKALSVVEGSAAP